MIYLWLYLILVILLALFAIIRWNRKYNLILLILFSLFLLIPVLILKIIDHKGRIKNSQETPKILSSLTKDGLKFHLLFGSLLFFWRNKNFMDNDIDIGIFSRDFKRKNVLKILQKNKFSLKEEWWLRGKICELSFTRDKTQLDIFIIYENGDFAPTFDEKNNRYSRRPKKRIWKAIKIQHKEMVFWIPDKTDDWLTWNYGEWRKKDPNYHWFKGSASSPAIIVKSHEIKYKRHF